MAKYGVTFVNQTTSASSPGKSIAGGAPGATLTRQCEIVEVIATGSGVVAPADLQHSLAALYNTQGAPGTSTAYTPSPFSANAANAAKTVWGVNFSAEPTTQDARTLSPLTYGFNQRGGMRWAVPQGEGIMLVGTAAKNGISFPILSSSAGACDCTVMFWEP